MKKACLLIVVAALAAILLVFAGWRFVGAAADRELEKRTTRLLERMAAADVTGTVAELQIEQQYGPRVPRELMARVRDAIRGLSRSGLTWRVKGVVRDANSSYYAWVVVHLVGDPGSGPGRLVTVQFQAEEGPWLIDVARSSLFDWDADGPQSR